jgi:hypothetical protein
MTQDYNALPADDFNDNMLATMWRVFEDDHDGAGVVEYANRLNLDATGKLVAMAYSCVGHWKLNDNQTNTTVLDSSGKQNDGTAQRNTEILHTTGKIDGALIFNGSSDYVNLGYVIGTGAYTKVAWVKREDGNFGNNIISSATASHAFFAPSAYSFKLSAGHNGVWDVVQDTEQLAADQWYQVAVTFDPDVDSGKMVLYKDGAVVDEANNVPSLTGASSTYIGRYAGGNGFYGSIDNVFIFDRALTSDEISILYNQGNGTETFPHDTLLAHYASRCWGFDVNQTFAYVGMGDNVSIRMLTVI